MALAPKSALARARACIRIETAALRETARGLGAEFVATARAVEAAIAAGGKLILSGVGKSAHVAQKIAATFNSTGVSSCFLDATQALHGDLGLCDEGDLAVLLSNSGQSDEILRLLPLLRRFGLRIVAFTANPSSDLARERRPSPALPRAAGGLPAQARAHRKHDGGPRPGRRARHGPPRGARPHPRRLREVPSRRQPRAACSCCAPATSCAPATGFPAAPTRSDPGRHPRHDQGEERQHRPGPPRRGRLTGILTDGDFRRAR